MIQVVIRALDILEFVARDTEKTSSLTEIANALELNQATCSMQAAKKATGWEPWRITSPAIYPTVRIWYWLPNSPWKS
jgi:hypothetical protein